MVMRQWTHIVSSTKPQLSGLRSIKKHYTLAADYWGYNLFERSFRYDETAFNYISKLVKKTHLQMETHFSIQKTQTLFSNF